MNLANIELLILDVDGVLTDGRLIAGANGEPEKAFFVQDGYAIKLWREAGGGVALLSSRGEASVRRRAAELGVERVHLGVSNKLAGYETVLSESGRTDAQVAYIGDDIPDVEAMRRCAFPVAVGNAAAAVKRAARYVTRRTGGAGAVAEVIELMLRKRGQRNRTEP